VRCTAYCTTAIVFAIPLIKLPRLASVACNETSNGMTFTSRIERVRRLFNDIENLSFIRITVDDVVLPNLEM
jgi:hypothetical protein